MSRPLLCVTVTAADDGRAARSGATRSPTPIWSSCGSTRSAIPTSPARSPAAARPVIVTCRPAWEGGQLQGIGGGAPAAARRGAGARRRVRRRRVARRLRRSDRARRAAAASCCRTTTSTAVPADLAGIARARCARPARRSSRLPAQADRLSDCVPLLELGAASRPRRRRRADRHGRRTGSRRASCRRGSARRGPTRATLRERRPADAPRRCSTTTGSARSTDATDVYGLVGSPVAHSVSPAMHNAAFAATGVDAVYLPLPAADADDFIDVRARARPEGRQRHDSRSRSSLFDQRRRGRCRGAPRRRDQHDSRRWTARWIGGNTDVAGFLQPLQRSRRRAARAARVDSRRRRRRAGRRGGARVARRRRVACTPATAQRAEAVRDDRRRRVGRLAAGAGQLGPAGQLHADRHAPARRRHRRCRRRC